MKIFTFSLAILLLLCVSCAKPKQYPENEINSILVRQVQSWNQGDLNGFMQGYWNSDSLIFTGGNAMHLGWNEALDRYKKSYPNAAAMGELQFKDLSTKSLGDDAAFTVGTWQLLRKVDTLQGRFTLVWKKIDNQWLIIADHSS